MKDESERQEIGERMGEEKKSSTCRWLVDHMPRNIDYVSTPVCA